MRVRKDLGSVVHVRHEGQVLILRPGDEVPKGVDLGSHIVQGEKEAPVRVSPLPPETPEAAPAASTRKKSKKASEEQGNDHGEPSDD